MVYHCCNDLCRIVYTWSYLGFVHFHQRLLPKEIRKNNPFFVYLLHVCVDLSHQNSYASGDLIIKCLDSQCGGYGFSILCACLLLLFLKA